MKAFQECLNSDLPCQEIIRKMNNLSKYEIIEGIITTLRFAECFSMHVTTKIMILSDSIPKSVSR